MGSLGSFDAAPSMAKPRVYFIKEYVFVDGDYFELFPSSLSLSYYLFLSSSSSSSTSSSTLALYCLQQVNEFNLIHSFPRTSVFRLVLQRVVPSFRIHAIKCHLSQFYIVCLCDE